MLIAVPVRDEVASLGIQDTLLDKSEVRGARESNGVAVGKDIELPL